MNAASSVLGSVLAMVIAIQFGLNVTLACGAAAYCAGHAVASHLQEAISSQQLANCFLAVARSWIVHRSIRFLSDSDTQFPIWVAECVGASVLCGSKRFAVPYGPVFEVDSAENIFRRFSLATCKTTNPPCYNHSLG